MIIDLNGFKAVNDTLGHHVGDDLLREVARRFAEAAPQGVTVARLGGDEFAVLVRPTSTGEPMQVARSLLDALEEPFAIGQERLHLSGAAGIAIAPAHGSTVSDLLKRADIAMYAAKNGAGRVRHLPRGHRRQRPLAALADGRAAAGHRRRRRRHRGRAGRRPVHRRIGSAEALVRWHHPVRGTLRPDLFLPLAERNGLIVPLTELVLDRAVAACARWREQGLEIGISVNLSARSLLDNAASAAVARVLSQYNLPSQLLTLEITESIVLSDADRALGPARRPAPPRRSALPRRLRHRLLLADPPVRAARSSS